MGKLDDKVAIITGATSGIGEHSALLFAKEGAKVVVVGRNEKRGNDVVSRIKNDGGEAIFVSADLTSISCIDNIIDAAINRYGKIDILFNNAGVAEAIPFMENTEEIYDRIMTLDLKTPFFLTQAAMPYLKETKGNVLFTTSVAAHRPVYNTYLYNMSKAGLAMLCKCLAAHYASEGLRFNAISPGTFDTPLVQVPDEYKEAICKKIPAGRMGDPDEIARLAVFVVSGEVPYLNGADILIDGAFELKVD